MPPEKLDFPWRTQRLKHGYENPKEENGHDKVVEIDDDSPTAKISLYDGSIISEQSRFVPNVRGAAASTHKSTKTSRSTPSSESEEIAWEKRSAPEKELTLFATRLAVLEKIASNVGTLGFIWATVVLLGGYAITLREIDFWFVTVILVTEGARIFGRSHELELQHQDAGTRSTILRAFQISSDAFFRSSSVVRTVVSNLVRSPGASGGDGLTTSKETETLQSPIGVRVHSVGRLKRTWSTSKVPLVPFMQWLFKACHVSLFFYWMQLLSAMLTIVLSALRLANYRHFRRPNEVDTGRNHSAALMIFYSLTVFEALVFLLERCYWLSLKEILTRVNDMCGLSRDDLGTTKRFFYDVYAKCLSESIFEGLKTDLVNYALTLLQSDTLTEQVGGLRVLLTFSSQADFFEDTLRTICTRQGAIERLLEMITWKNFEEREIRKMATDILCKLVKYNRNGIRVAAISGSIEGIFSLLSQDRDEMVPEYTYIRQRGSEPTAQMQLATHLGGLRIMKHLAKDPLNCIQIGNTRGLLIKLVSYIETDPQMLRNAEEPEQRITAVKKSLELLNMLAGMTGFGGKTLREEIVRVVYTLTNLRNILEYGEAHMMLQELATETLTCLAMDDDVRDAIGRSGGILRNLFELFLKERIEGDRRQLKLAVKAGEALTLLALKNEANCTRMLRLKVLEGGMVRADERGSGKEVVEVLIDRMCNWEVGALVISILRSFCAYSSRDHKRCRARIAASTPEIVKLVMQREGRTQEAALGLAARTVAEASDEDFNLAFSERLPKEALAVKVANLLIYHSTASTKLPRLRRFCVELAIALVERDRAAFLPAFAAQNFLHLLHGVADTAADIENYYTFSGAVGVTPHSVPMAHLVDKAIDKFRAHRHNN